MAVGKYRHEHTWYDSKFWGTHEELLTEGVSAGRGWAVVRSWHPHPRYTSDRAEKYILRIDISEWYASYGRCFCEMSEKIRRICMAIKSACSLHSGVWFDNMSPGWWENGFSRQLCLTATVFKYKSEEDRFRSVIETGKDWDTFDYNETVFDICNRLNPVFKMFAGAGKPGIPFADDF